MACEDKISNLCGTVTYGSCVKYEGGVSNESELDPVNDCLSLEETTQDIYNQLDDLNNRVGGNDVQGTVVSVNNIDPDEDGNVQLDADDIPQGSVNQYVSPSEKATWNGKQNALGFVPVPETRTVNGKALNANITINKNDVGLGNVQNIDTTIASNIVQTSNYRFVTDTEKAIWNSASSGVVEILYSNLLALKNTSTLVKGKTYLITDYTTTYTQPITLAAKTSGVIEPLYVTAMDVDKLHNVCKSKLYPQDIVYYEITGDIGTVGGTEGFTKGKIYRRIDTIKNNDIGTDWRHVKYDRGGTDYLLFEDYTSCENNIIKENSLFDNVVGAAFANNTIDSDFSGNTIGVACVGNTIKEAFQDNYIGDQFLYNNIENSFGGNTIGTYFANNRVDSFFQGNVVGDSFSDNNVGTVSVTNIIGSNVVFNKISNNFQSNTIGDGFQNCDVGIDFLVNIVGSDCNLVTFQGNVNSRDFTLIDIYSKNYVNTVTRKSDITYQYSYVDGFGDIIIEDIV